MTTRIINNQVVVLHGNSKACNQISNKELKPLVNEGITQIKVEKVTNCEGNGWISNTYKPIPLDK